MSAESKAWNADVFLLLQIVGYIQRKDWDRARTALRLYTYETRKAMTRFTNASNDSVSSKPHAHTCLAYPPTYSSPPLFPFCVWRSHAEHVNFHYDERALDRAKTVVVEVLRALMLVLAGLFRFPLSVTHGVERAIALTTEISN